MEMGLAAPSHLAVPLVHNRGYVLYEYAHVLICSSAWLRPFGTFAKPEHSEPEHCSGWKWASPLRPTSPCRLYITGDMFYTNMLTFSFVLWPGCAHLAHLPNLSTPNLSTAQDGNGPRRSVPPRRAACT